jgi:vitamin B12 transporter
MRAVTATLAGVACVLFRVSIAAADPPLNAPPLEETVITATRTPTVLDNLAVPVIVITREEIERSLAGDVGELLQQHAGLEIARNGGPGQTASLFIRGTNSDHAVVMIDGVRINPGTLGGAAIQNISPETIERIEIVEGPRSALYGTDAIGGVVNIFTRAGAQRGFSGVFSGGRYGTGSAQFDGGFGLGERTNVGFSVGRQQSDGFPTLDTSSMARGYSNTTANLFGEVEASDALKLRARAWRASGISEYSDFFAAPVDQDYQNSAYSLEAQLQPHEGLRSRLNLSRITDDIRQNESSDFVRTRRNALDWQSDYRLGGGHELTAGALLTRENTTALSFGTFFDVDTTIDNFYLQDHWQTGRQDALAALGYTDNQTFGHQLTWNAEYGVTLGAGTRLSAAAGTAFHAPDSTDRFGFGGNPLLKPESSRQVEVGIRQSLAAGQQVYLTAFRNNIDKLIVFVVTDPVTFDGHNENVEHTRIDGIEAGYEFRGAVWHARLGLTFQDPRDLTTGEQLLRRARHTATLSIERSAGAFGFGTDVLASGPREDVGFPATVELKGYTLVNLFARYSISPQWTVQARLDNALDQRYELANGYNSPRRGLTLATRYHFR